MTSLAVASSNVTGLRFVRQTAGFGEVITPEATDGTQFRFTSESLATEQSTEVSDEISGDAQVLDSVRTDISTGGTVNLEWSLESFDAQLHALMMAAKVSAGYLEDAAGAEVDDNQTNSIQFVPGAGVAAATIVIGGTPSGTAPAAGDWILVYGADDDPNNGWFRVGAYAANTITLEGYGNDDVFDTTKDQPDLVADTSAALGSVRIYVAQAATDRFVNGSTLDNSYFLIERDFSSTVTVAKARYTRWVNMVPNNFALSVPVSGKITGSFGYVGTVEARDGTRYFVWPGTPTAHDNSVLNSITNVTQITAFLNINGATDNSVIPVRLDASSFDMTMTNNVERNQKIGTLGAASMRIGAFEASGNIQAYYGGSASAQDSRDRIQAFLDQSRVGLAIGFVDTASDSTPHGLLFFFPAAKLSRGTSSNPGKNQVIFEELSFNAFKDAAGWSGAYDGHLTGEVGYRSNSTVQVWKI
jgi:hypothetical protein